MIECRGRNGWFRLMKANVEHFHQNHEKFAHRVAISLSSKNSFRNVAPIYFSGTKAEIEALLSDLLEKVSAIQ
jgi:hypothetical protein